MKIKTVRKPNGNRAVFIGIRKTQVMQGADGYAPFDSIATLCQSVLLIRGN